MKLLAPLCAVQGNASSNSTAVQAGLRGSLSPLSVMTCTVVKNTENCIYVFLTETIIFL